MSTSLVKTEKKIALLREGGKRHAYILGELARAVKPGVTTEELDNLARKLIAEGGDKAAFLGYTPEGADRPYPAALCVSVNDEIVHGIPNETVQTLKEGDIVSLDLGLNHKGAYTDAAITVPVGAIDAKAQELLRLTEKALYAGIKAAHGNGRIGDIGYAIQHTVAKSAFSIAEDLAGHGVGDSQHEDPYVPNFGKKNHGEHLFPGMVIAIEPILNEGSERIELQEDGYTYKTTDGGRSAHFEHTVLITERGTEILTK